MASRRAVVGIAFDEDVSRVLLTQKERPRWQQGYFNGVGGKIEENEVAADAMSREFLEETGVQVNADSWLFFLKYQGPNFEIFFYRVFLPTDLFDSAQTKTDEIVVPTPLAQIPATRTIYNLQWIIPLMMDSNVRTPIIITKNDNPGES